MTYHTFPQRQAEVRAIAGPEQADLVFVVIPNDAPAYAHSGAWGIYDVHGCTWVNFRSTKTEAEQLRDYWLNRTA